MTRYEFQVMWLGEHVMDEDVTRLNKHGRNGWQVVGVINSTHGRPPAAPIRTQVTLILQRPLQEEGYDASR